MEFWSGNPPGHHFHKWRETRGLGFMCAFSLIAIKATVMYFNKHNIFYALRKSGSLLNKDLSLLSL